jgi:hypothetical protein
MLLSHHQNARQNHDIKIGNRCYNIKMDLREMGWDGGDWIDLVQDRDQWRALVNAVMNLWVP